MFFRDIVGQKELVADLTREVDSGKISHGKLFVGSPGYGTLAAALAYSRYVLCEQRSSGDACGNCSSCLQMSNLQHPDVHFVFPVVQTVSKTSDGVL
ncbi:MAG: DNA polymerase III subunit delta, partial [Flavobacteriia bacterium]|nr:DNA polymerase III subunit delta [Flavobacteriia bacterium]